MKKTILLATAVFLLLGCKGGEKMPLEPESTPLNVSGEWRQLARLRTDYCDIGFSSEVKSTFTIIQFDGRITMISDDPVLPLQTGTLDLATGEYVAEPFVIATDAGKTTIKEKGIFTADGKYNGQRWLLLDYNIGSCRATYRLDAIREEDPQHHTPQ
jgi:hypothetical protein